MRFESVTIAAGEKARCKSRPRMNRRDCKGRAGPARSRRGSSMWRCYASPSPPAERR